jgi:hypothetical protein
MVESDDAVDLGERDIEEEGEIQGGLAGDIAVVFLHLMQDHDEIPFLVLPCLDMVEDLSGKVRRVHVRLQSAYI